MKIYPKRILKILFYSILFFAFLKPDSLEHIGLKWLDISLVVIDGMLMIILCYFALIRKFKISSISLSIGLIYFVIGISTLFGTKDFFSLLKVAGTALGMGLLTDFCMQKDPKIYFQSSLFTLTILFTINFITILKYYPIGMYRLDYVVGDLYFMGHDNGMIYNLIPFCSLAILYTYCKKGKIISKISLYAIFLTFISELYVKSATGIVESFLLLILIFFIDNKFLSKFINPKFIFLLFFILNYLVVILRIQNYFSWFFVDVLGKDLTFTGRTYLWDYAINMIKNNPIFGFGMGVQVYGNGHSYPHPHCLILDFIFKGGIITLLIFCILIINYIKKYKSSNNKIISKMLLLPVFVLLIGEITASNPYKPLFWSLLVLICYSDEIEKMFIKN